MPMYEEECRACGHRFHYIQVRVTVDTRPCPKCGEATDRLYSLSNPKVFQAFSTRNLDPDGREIHVGRQRDLSRYCNEYGVVHCPDPKDFAPKKRAVQPGIDTPLVD